MRKILSLVIALLLAVPVIGAQVPLPAPSDVTSLAHLRDGRVFHLSSYDKEGGGIRAYWDGDVKSGQ